MSTSLTTADRLEPGCVVILDPGGRSEEWVRVVSTAGAGPFTSEVRAVSWRERLWLTISGFVRRASSLWLRRVWWPVVDGVVDRYEAWRQR